MAQPYEEKVKPNVVPSAFSPKPEDFLPQVSQELRSQQSRWAQGFALGKIEYLENQLRTAHFKREIYTLNDGYKDFQAEEKLSEDINVAKTARTVMMDHISDWAGPYEERHFKSVVLPQVWSDFVRQVSGEPAPEETADDTETAEAVVEEPLAPEEEELEEDQPLPSARYDDLASKPRSQVEAPPEISLGDVLGKIEKDNSED